MYYFFSLWYDSTWDWILVSRATGKHSNHYAIGLMSRVFANGLEDLGSNPGWVIPKTQKMVLDTTLLNTQHYKVWSKGKMVKSREWSSPLPYFSVL